MHIVWGKKTKIIGVYEDPNPPCEDCGEGTLVYFVYQEYYHLFWLPAFPIQKYGGLFCNTCEKSRTHVINTKCTEYEKTTKTPLSMYSFPLLVLALVVINLIVSIL